MNHIGTQELETERLILRKFEISDAENMFKNWSSDSEVTKFLTWETHKSIDDSKEIISFWAKEYEKPDFYQWAIVLKETNEVIGSISVVKIMEKVNLVETGYAISRKFWGKGITTEAFKKVIQFLFEKVEINKLQAKHDLKNPASGKVMKKCGLIYEGTLRQKGFCNAGVGDLVYYGLLKEEYFS